MLLDVLHGLVDRGNTVLVIEHNLDVIKTADWIIDLGPEGGARGGTVVASGTPEEVARVAGSYTGAYLRPLLEAAGLPVPPRAGSESSERAAALPHPPDGLSLTPSATRTRHMVSREDIESYLDRLTSGGGGANYHEVEPGLWIVRPSGALDLDVVVHYSPPVVLLRVKVMNVPKGDAAAARLNRRLLELTQPISSMDRMVLNGSPLS